MVIGGLFACCITGCNYFFGNDSGNELDAYVAPIEDTGPISRGN